MIEQEQMYTYIEEFFGSFLKNYLRKIDNFRIIEKEAVLQCLLFSFFNDKGLLCLVEQKCLTEIDENGFLKESRNGRFDLLVADTPIELKIINSKQQVTNIDHPFAKNEKDPRKLRWVGDHRKLCFHSRGNKYGYQINLSEDASSIGLLSYFNGELLKPDVF